MSKQKIELIIHIILGLAIWIFTIYFIGLILNQAHMFEVMNSLELTAFEKIKWLFYTGRYFNLLITFLAAIGILFRKPIGWTLAICLFYYVLSALLTGFDGTDSSMWIDLWFLLIPVLFIVLLNLSCIRERFHIYKGSGLIMNMVSISIAMALTLLFQYQRLHVYRSVTEIIQLIN